MKDIIKSHCNSCKQETNHAVLFKKGVSNNENGFHEEYHMVECLGCELISFTISESFSDDPEGTYWRNFPDPLFWNVYDFLKEDAFDSLPVMISDLYEEVSNAFKTDSAVLAGIGLRTLIEAVCLQQKIEGKNLKEKIKNLHSQGLISKAELPILDKLRLIGNVSAHQIKSISLDKLQYALSIINHVLQSIYHLPQIDKKMKI